MAQQVYNMKRKNFNKEIEGGKRLTYEELRGLDNNFRVDYMKEIIKEERKVQEEVDITKNKLQSVEDALVALDYKIIDIQDEVCELE